MNDTLTQSQTTEIQDILMRQLDVNRDQLTQEASIIGDLGADSLDVVEIGMNVEERFDLTIPDEKWEAVRTVGELYDAVAELLVQPGHCASRD